MICYLAVQPCLPVAEKVEPKGTPMNPMTFAVLNISWHGQSAIEVHDKLTIFIDPYELKKTAKADLILITHPHPECLSPADIKKIQTPDTVIVSPDDKECRKKLSGDVRYLKPGQTITVKDVVIEAVPAYNRGFKFFHNKSFNWVGYILTVEGVRIYDAGDTDRIPEMKQTKADIAFFPISGIFSMGPKEAAKAALDINPKVVIPVLYGRTSGSASNAEEFKKLLENKLNVLIKEEE